MPNNLCGPGTKIEPNAADVQARQDAARAEDAQRQRTAAAAGRDRRRI